MNDDALFTHNREIKADDGILQNVTFSPNASTIAACGHRLVQLFEVESGELIWQSAGHIDIIRDLMFSMNGALIASGSVDKTVRLWDANSGQLLKTLRGHRDSVACVALSPDGKTLYSGADSDSHLSEVRLWDVESARWQHRIRTDHGNGCSSMTVSSDGRHCAISGNAGWFTVYKVNFGLSVLFRGEHHANKAVTQVSLSSDAARVISAGLDNTIQLWDVESGERQLTLDGPSQSPGFQSAAFWSDERILSVTGDGLLQLWDTRDGTCMAGESISTPSVRGVAISLDGSTVATIRGDDELVLWSIVHSNQPENHDET